MELIVTRSLFGINKTQEELKKLKLNSDAISKIIYNVNKRINSTDISPIDNSK